MCQKFTEEKCHKIALHCAWSHTYICLVTGALHCINQNSFLWVGVFPLWFIIHVHTQLYVNISEKRLAEGEKRWTRRWGGGWERPEVLLAGDGCSCGRVSAEASCSLLPRKSVEKNGCAKQGFSLTKKLPSSEQPQGLWLSSVSWGLPTGWRASRGWGMSLGTDPACKDEPQVALVVFLSVHIPSVLPAHPKGA